MSGRVRWQRKFAAAIAGCRVSFRSQDSFVVHFAVTALGIAVAAVAQISLERWAILTLAIAGVLAAELFNTAIENVVRVIHPDHHDTIGDALDAAAAAVLVLAVGSVAVGLFLLVGPVVRWFQTGW